MRSPLQRSLEQALEEISQAIQYAFAAGERCFIPFSVYSSWPEKVFRALEKSRIIRKAGPQKRKAAVRCGCESGDLLEIEGSEKEGFFIQCFHCGFLRVVDVKELECYEAAALYFADFLTLQVEDISAPEKLKEDELFFVGELPESIHIFLSFSFPDEEARNICFAKAFSQQALIVTLQPTPHSAKPSFGKELLVLAINERGLFSLKEDGELALESERFVPHFLKDPKRQKAQNTRWAKDPQHKAKEKLRQYIANLDLSVWSGLNHMEISQEIQRSKEAAPFLGYQDKKGASQEISITDMRKMVADLLKLRGEEYRIYGNPNYNEDRLSWGVVELD